MADELQALLDRISSEGLDKAEQQSAELLGASRAEASAVLSEARDQAARIVSDAEREQRVLAEKGRESLQQAARDVLLSLRGQLEERIRRVTKAFVGEAMGADVLAGIVAELVRSYVAQHGSESRVEALLNPAQVAELAQALGARLGEELRANCELTPVPTIDAGFMLTFGDQEAVYDFTDEALSEALAAFLNPKLREILSSASA